MHLHIPANKFEIDIVQEAGYLPEGFIFPGACGKRSHHGAGRKAVFFMPGIVDIMIEQSERSGTIQRQW